MSTDPLAVRLERLERSQTRLKRFAALLGVLLAATFAGGLDGADDDLEAKNVRADTVSIRSALIGVDESGVEWFALRRLADSSGRSAAYLTLHDPTGDSYTTLRASSNGEAALLLEHESDVGRSHGVHVGVEAGGAEVLVFDKSISEGRIPLPPGISPPSHVVAQHPMGTLTPRLSVGVDEGRARVLLHDDRGNVTTRVD